MNIYKIDKPGKKCAADHPDYFKQQVQKPDSLKYGIELYLWLWLCNLLFSDGNINAEKFIFCLQDMFSRDIHMFFKSKPHPTYIISAWLKTKRSKYRTGLNEECGILKGKMQH